MRAHHGIAFIVGIVAAEIYRRKGGKR